MKRTLAIALMVAFAIGAIGGPVTAAKVEKLEKVDICHVNGASDPIPAVNYPVDNRMFYLGQVLNVAAAAVPGHEGHGDSTVFRTDSDPAIPSGLAALYVQADLLDLKAWKKADCFITEYVD